MRGPRGDRAEPAALLAPATSPTWGWVISPQNRLPCPSLVTHPADHVDKVRQERCDLGVSLQVLESNLKRKEPDCAGSTSPKEERAFCERRWSTSVVNCKRSHSLIQQLDFYKLNPLEEIPTHTSTATPSPVCDDTKLHTT